ncbi:MAG: heavy metal translocating P-type ATPase [Roseburia sp.]
MRKERFDVAGMTCSACSSHVEKSVSKTEGVHEVSVNLLTNSMQVKFDEKITDALHIIKAVENAGYKASVRGQASIGNEEAPAALRQKEMKVMKQRLALSLIFWVPLMYVSMGHMIYSALNLPMPPLTMHYFHGTKNAITYAFTQLLLLVPILVANQKYFKNGFRTLLQKNPNMDSLIAIGSGAAIVYGIFAIYRIGYGLGYGNPELVERYGHELYFESAGTILTLITIGKYLEARSKGKTSEAITKLMNLTPKTVTLLRDGKEVTADVSEVAVGDLFLIKPGEAVVVDGVIEEGKSSFDESAITGESIPVQKQEGDKIVSASINRAGLVKARAVKVGEDTTIAQIIKLMEEAASSKAPIARLADKIAGIFVPAVLVIALGAFVVWLTVGADLEFALSSAIAVLVISCPCALGLATPVAIMVGTGKGAENGILIKSGEALETAHLIDTVVLDKTGTITQGKPLVTDVDCYEDMAEQKLLKIAGSLEKGSEHPLAEAIVKHCDREGIALSSVSDFTAVFGKGIVGTVEGKAYYAGNEKLMEERGVLLPKEIRDRVENLAKQGKTPLIFAEQKKAIGIVAVADVVKPTSKAAVEQLHRDGIHVIMLTGDHAVTAEAIRTQVGIDEVIAGVLPAQKEAKISELRAEGHKVAMVGDGINDAPALASADVGIAIGAGTDVAIESADIVLMKNDLQDVSGAIRLSRAVIRNIKQNLFWAFFYNTIGIPLAAGVFYPVFGIKLNPMFGAAAMSLSSICVVGNALRLKLVPIEKTRDQASEDARESDKRGEGEKVKKTIGIEGMMCAHCTGRVEKALQRLPGVTDVAVNLEEKNAVVSCEASVTDEELKNAVTEEGYEVTGVCEK